MNLTHVGETVRLAILGLGGRGIGQMKCLLDMEDVQVTAVCDVYTDRIENAQKIVQEKKGNIPFGSTNDCATTLDLPKIPTQAALIAARDGVPRESDIGKLNGKPFVYVAAFGAFTQVAYETSQDLKNTFGHLAYIMEGIASLPSITPYHIKVEYDGNVLEDDFYFGMVSNAYSIGGIKQPAKDYVVLDDGLFEVDLVKKPVSIADVANGFQWLTDPLSSKGMRVHFKASHLTFTCDRPLPWTIDGEYGGNQAVNEVVNCQKALTIIRGS